MSDFVLFTHLWQRRGFMNMPPEFRRTFFNALRTDPPEPTGEQDDVHHRFVSRCDQWIQEGRVILLPGTLDSVLEKSRTLIVPKWRYRLTIGDVEWNVDGRAESRVVEERRLEGRWCWSYEGYAYGVFWALIYHVENEWLRRPHHVWETLQQHRVEWASESGYNEELRECFWLALFERLLALHSDQELERPHYVSNIVERVELKDEERRERVALFRSCIADLLARTIGRIMSDGNC